MNKQKIEINFDKAVGTYEDVANIQKKCAKILVELLFNNCNIDFKNILDLGAGTGFVTEELIKKFSDAEYTLNDISSNMIKYVSEKYASFPNIKYIKSDIETYDFKFHNLAISNLAFQWLNDLPGTLKSLYNNSNVLAFSTLLNDNFIEWQELCEEYSLQFSFHKYFTSNELQEYISSFEPENYAFKTIDFKLKFNHPIEFLKYLKNLGANTSAKNTKISDFKKLLKLSFEKFEVTYKVFFAILMK